MSPKKMIVSDHHVEATIREMERAFTILDFVDSFKRLFPDVWGELVDRYGLIGSGARYTALTYLSNRLSSYSRRKEGNLLEPTPKGWSPREGRYLRRTTTRERGRFGSHWIVIFRKREPG